MLRYRIAACVLSLVVLLVTKAAIRADESSRPAADIAELALRLADLSADDAALVRRYVQLCEPLAAGVVDRKQAWAERAKAKQSIEASAARIGDRLLELSLAEAGELGAQLDERHAGKHAEFAREVFFRQHRALDAVRATHRRLLSGEGSADKYINTPLILRAVTPNWKSADLKPEHWQEATRVSFARAHAEFGPEATDVSDADLEHVAMLASLEDLNLNGAQATDEGLAFVARLGRLRTLELADVKKMTDAGLAQLAGIVELRQLGLQQTNITGAGLKEFDRCRHLSSLAVSGEFVGNDAIRAVAAMSSLVELSVSAPKATEATLRGLPRLKSLSLYAPGATRMDVRDLPSLAILSLSAKSAEEFLLADLPQLGALDVSSDRPGCRLRLSGMGPVTKLALLGQHSFDTESCRAIGQVNTLRSLEISPPLTDDDVAHFAGLKQLEMLRLVNPHQSLRLTDRSFAVIGQLANIQDLYIVSGGATDAGVRAFGELRQLRTLHLGGLRGTGDGLRALSKLPHLTRLTFHRSQLDRLDLSGFPALTNLRLNDDVVGAVRLVGVPKLEHFDGSDVRLKMLDVQDAPSLGWLYLSMHDADKIERVTLRKLPRLGTLALIGKNPDGGIDRLANHTNITDEALRYAAEMPRLQRVDLNHSKITDAGLACLAPCKEIGDLNLFRSQITDAGLAHLRGMPGLMFFGTGETRVTRHGLVELKKILPKLHVEKPNPR
ncbi:MAG: hypothetical protein WD176_06860 [Pirellulales bacterium]